MSAKKKATKKAPKKPSRRKMPRQKPRRSKQDYRTPPEFLDAVEARFGRLHFDLAASSSDVIRGVDGFFSPKDNSLAQDWREHFGQTKQNLWLNPPFERISEWAEKCADIRWRHAWTFLLVPASVGSSWYRIHCHGRGYVMPLAGSRLSFDGEGPYPKDLMLVAFGFSVAGFEPWFWRLDLKQQATNPGAV